MKAKWHMPDRATWQLLEKRHPFAAIINFLHVVYGGTPGDSLILLFRFREGRLLPIQHSESWCSFETGLLTVFHEPDGVNSQIPIINSAQQL